MDDNTRTVLEVLGDGGTTDMATRVIVWMAGDPNALGIKAHDIVDRAELATMMGRSRQSLAKLLNAAVSFPAPFRTLAGGEELYDREQVQRWMAGNPDLVGSRA